MSLIRKIISPFVFAKKPNLARIYAGSTIDVNFSNLGLVANFLILYFFLCPLKGISQDTTLRKRFFVDQYSTDFLSKLNNKYNSIGDGIEAATFKLLLGLQKKERKIKKKLSTTDSSKAKQLFEGCDDKYTSLQSSFQSQASTLSKEKFPLKEYIPGIDSVQTALDFLNKNSSKLPTAKLKQIQALSASLKILQGKMQASNEVQTYLKEREQYLKEQLKQLPFGRELTKMNKQIYYYQHQIQEYKNILHDPQKMEQTLLIVAHKVPAFNDFMSKNSYLSNLFTLPTNYGDSSALLDLQSKSQVQQMISQQIGANLSSVGAGQVQQLIQQGMQQAQQESSMLQNLVNQTFNGANSSFVMPNFKPNSQKGKSILKRIQLGWNLQSEAGILPNPNTCVFGLSAGYKISDNKIMGLGASYILGTGTEGLNHIKLTNQGIGLRSFIDIKAKKSIWLTGGFEYNYMQAFGGLSSLPGVDLWQKSALIGISKKFKAAKKEGNIQLLYDFLANSEIPRGRMLKFRMGYNF